MLLGKQSIKCRSATSWTCYIENMSTATTQQWLLYERRNQAAEMRKQIIGLMHKLCQSFSGTDCDKIMDLLVAQCHGMLQQYVDNMQQMIHHTIAAAMQLEGAL